MLDALDLPDLLTEAGIATPAQAEALKDAMRRRQHNRHRHEPNPPYDPALDEPPAQPSRLRYLLSTLSQMKSP